jgi:hypothetical protein
VTGSSAATNVRLAPPMVWNDPPAKTTPAWGRMARTVLSAPGFHGVASPVATSRAAMRLRGCPPIALKFPPA